MSVGAARRRSGLPYSPDAVPDFVTEFGGREAAHRLFEVKIYNPVLCTSTDLRRGASFPFGATEPRLRSLILGDHHAPASGAALAPLPPPRGPRRGQYAQALAGGHDVTPLIHEVWGGMARDAQFYLRQLAAVREGVLSAEAAEATWATQDFGAFWGQRLSLTLQRCVAQQILCAAQRVALTSAFAGRPSVAPPAPLFGG